MWGKNNQQACGDMFLGTFHVIHIPLIWTFAHCPLGTKGNSGLQHATNVLYRPRETVWIECINKNARAKWK